MDKPQEIAHARTDEGDAEPGTGVGSVGPAIGPEIGSVLGGHGGQPAATIFHMQDGGNSDFEAQAKAHINVTHNDKHNCGGTKMSDKSGHVFEVSRSIVQILPGIESRSIS